MKQIMLVKWQYTRSCAVVADAHGRRNVMRAQAAASSAPPALHSCPQGADLSCHGTAAIGSWSASSSRGWQTQKDADHSAGCWLSARISCFSHACRDPVNSTELGIIGITWCFFAFRHILKLSSACGLCSKFAVLCLIKECSDCHRCVHGELCPGLLHKQHLWSPDSLLKKVFFPTVCKESSLPSWQLGG